MLQQAFLGVMAAEEITFEKTLDAKLTALCEANGIKFKKK